MKISEMTNDQATEAMLRLSGPLASICNDEDVATFIDKIKSLDGDVPLPYIIGKFIPDLVRIALQRHKSDLYAIVGALLMVPTSTVGDMCFKDTVNAVRNSWDEILTDFFTPSANAEKKDNAVSA